MSKGLAYYALRDALSEPGCAVCRLKATTIERYLDGLLWESINDPGTRHKIRQAQGFCHVHAWALARTGASLGTALLMRDVLHNALKTLTEAHRETLSTKSLRQFARVLFCRQRPSLSDELVAQLTPRARCPACVQGEEMEPKGSNNYRFNYRNTCANTLGSTGMSRKRLWNKAHGCGR